MSLEFKPLSAADIDIMTPYFDLRSNLTCDSVFLDGYLWKDFYNVRYATSDGKALHWIMTIQGEEFAILPICKHEDLAYYFEEITNYFNEVLNRKLKIYLADENGMSILNLDPNRFIVEELPDAADYLYSAEALRTLSGKKLRKKKNHINAFLREYEGRYEYRRLCCSDRYDVWNFLTKWRDAKGDDVEEHLDGEVLGIHEILKNCSSLHVRMGGVYIDGQLEAFSVGSYNRIMKMAIIHIEKANAEIRGLYPFINQQFIYHEFAEAEIVNREDDLGLEGLRKAKLSYEPIGYAKKFRITQK